MTNLMLYIKDISFNVIQRRIQKFPVSILMYHSVGYNDHFFTVTPESFRRQMSYLKNKKYHVLSLVDVVNRLVQNKLIPAKTVVLTFDDGYEDNFVNAFSILSEFGFLATIFISTDFIGSERPVRGIPMRYLTREQIVQMHTSKLINFQSHGLSHYKLTELSFDEIEREMKDSKAVLEELLNTPCNLFAYPFGKLNQNIRINAKRFFEGAVGVRRGYVSGVSDIMNLERQSVDSMTTFLRYRLKV